MIKNIKISSLFLFTLLLTSIMLFNACYCPKDKMSAPTASNEITMDEGVKKGDEYVNEKNYKEAVKHYNKALDKETKNIHNRKYILQKLADVYELDKDYVNVKKCLEELLKYAEEDIMNAKETVVKEKIEELDLRIKKQGD